MIYRFLSFFFFLNRPPSFLINYRGLSICWGKNVWREDVGRRWFLLGWSLNLRNLSVCGSMEMETDDSFGILECGLTDLSLRSMNI